MDSLKTAERLGSRDLVWEKTAPTSGPIRLDACVTGQGPTLLSRTEVGD